MSWWPTVLTGLITTVTVFISIHFFEPPLDQSPPPSITKPHVTTANAVAWANLTQPDRDWFAFNYWDGRQVLDERVPIPELPRVCAHEYTIESRSIVTEPCETCIICGMVVE